MRRGRARATIRARTGTPDDAQFERDVAEVKQAMEADRASMRSEIMAGIRRVIGAHVKASRSFRDLWFLWRDAYMATHHLSLDDDDHVFIIEQLEHAFYAGIATTWEIFTRVMPDEVSEEQGEAMLTRLNEELDAWVKGGTVS